LSEAETKERKKPVRLEKVAEDTGELVGKGLRKAWSVTKGFGKGVVDAIDKTKEPKYIKTCPHCSASVSSDASFCAHCGNELIEK
jgi:hypothetical protein